MVPANPFSLLPLTYIAAITTIIEIISVTGSLAPFLFLLRKLPIGGLCEAVPAARTPLAIGKMDTIAPALEGCCRSSTEPRRQTEQGANEPKGAKVLIPVLHHRGEKTSTCECLGVRLMQFLLKEPNKTQVNIS